MESCWESLELEFGDPMRCRLTAEAGRCRWRTRAHSGDSEVGFDGQEQDGSRHWNRDIRCSNHPESSGAGVVAVAAVAVAAVAAAAVILG